LRMGAGRGGTNLSRAMRRGGQSVDRSCRISLLGEWYLPDDVSAADWLNCKEANS